ncbi:MAG: hypothetical protein JSV05_02425 [Candidatus Bathyarchaeota archaeon]|nr:MAG: hypothetical protein JSV05_02425 [Candidatus Bathyarchaeota archaeon]
MLARTKVLQTIKDGKLKLDLRDMKIEVNYVKSISKIGKRAEIFIWSKDEVEILLYPTATLFSVRHELCHAKLFRMGIPLTNTETDLKMFPDAGDYLRMVVITEWYINELQKKFFNEYYIVDEIGTPRPPPFSDLPQLPDGKFTSTQIEHIVKIAKI